MLPVVYDASTITMVPTLSFPFLCSAPTLQKHTQAFVTAVFTDPKRTVLFWIFLSNTKKNEGEMGRKKASHAAKSFLSRNDSAIFHLNTNIYTKISPSHYAEITLISAGKIKSH